jgi:hypothetical protein
LLIMLLDLPVGWLVDLAGAFSVGDPAAGAELPGAWAKAGAASARAATRAADVIMRMVVPFCCKATSGNGEVCGRSGGDVAAR